MTFTNSFFSEIAYFIAQKINDILILISHFNNYSYGIFAV